MDGEHLSLGGGQPRRRKLILSGTAYRRRRWNEHSIKIHARLGVGFSCAGPDRKVPVLFRRHQFDRGERCLTVPLAATVSCSAAGFKASQGA
jgi:hypothetical protein